MNTNKVFVAGVGMTTFEKPGRREWDYSDMVRESAGKALADAGIDYQRIEHVCVGWVYGDSTAGQRAVYELGLTASRSSTSTTTTRLARRRCTSRARWSPAAWPTACSQWASRRWSVAR
jgi:acetyl-CoA acetyltransferase